MLDNAARERRERWRDPQERERGRERKRERVRERVREIAEKRGNERLERTGTPERARTRHRPEC